jgi:hypothetical protein
VAHSHDGGLAGVRWAGILRLCGNDSDEGKEGGDGGFHDDREGAFEMCVEVVLVFGRL